MTNKPFSKRMLQSKKKVGYRTHSYKWKYHPTPWKLFIDAVTKPREATLSLFGNKRFVYAIVILTIVIGATVLGQGPLFHSYISTSQPPPNPPNGDPQTILWQAQAGANDNSEFNTFLASYLTGVPCWATGFACLQLNPNSTNTAVAITQNPVDLSTVSGKQLYVPFGLSTTGTPNTNLRWGWFLTRNNTIPLLNLVTHTKSYDPIDDPAVAFAEEMYYAGSNNYQAVTYQQLDSLKPISTGNAGGCDGAGTCWISASGTFTFGNGHQFAGQLTSDMNFTGTTTTTGGPCSGGGVALGNGCSRLILGSGGSTFFGSSIVLPKFQFQGVSYYVGVYARDGLGVGINWLYMGHGNNVSFGFEIINYLPTAVVSTPSPTIDTGGFFGPVIRALIAIGVFIAQNIINFLAFLAGVLFPVLATVFGVLANALVGVLNAIGNFFGLGNIGTSISSFFSAVGNFLVNGVGAILGQISNAGNFFINGVTAFVNIAGTYWTKITSFFTALGNLLSILGTVFNDFLSLGAFSGNLALFMDWTWGMYKTYDEGTEGFHRWLDFNETVILKIGTLAYSLADHLLTVILRVKQLIVNWV